MPAPIKSTLWLTIYNPIWGNTPHWALKVTSKGSSGTNYYLQIFGEPGSFHFNETTGDDPVAAPHRKDIKIWDLDSLADVDRVRTTARDMRIDTETVLWNCQDWCIDVINELEEDYVIGVQEDDDEEDVREWKRLKRKLVKKMGPEV